MKKIKCEIFFDVVSVWWSGFHPLPRYSLSLVARFHLLALLRFPWKIPAEWNNNKFWNQRKKKIYREWHHQQKQHQMLFMASSSQTNIWFFINLLTSSFYRQDWWLQMHVNDANLSNRMFGVLLPFLCVFKQHFELLEA